jgi:glycosyltransferase involved in cell wall biosynthesis
VPWHSESKTDFFIKDNLPMQSANHNVSLLIPCYNCADYIAETIEQARSQTKPFAEIICYDDCSTDQTWEIIKTLNVKTIRGEKNMGSGFARNRLLEASQCEFVHFHDADDPFHSATFLEELTPFAGPDTISFCQWIRKDDKDGENVFLYDDIGKETDFIGYLIHKHIHLNAMIIPRQAALHFGGFPDWMRAQQDLGFSMRCAINGLSFNLCRKPLAIHIRNESSSTAKLSTVKNHLFALKLVSTLFAEFPRQYDSLLYRKFLYHAKSLALLGERKFISEHRDFIQSIPRRYYSGGWRERALARTLGIPVVLSLLSKKN